MRMRDALEEVKEFSNAEEQLDESILSFLRTGAITVNVAKGVQSGKKVQQKSRELRQVGLDIQRGKTPEEAQKLEKTRKRSDAFGRRRRCRGGFQMGVEEK